MTNEQLAKIEARAFAESGWVPSMIFNRSTGQLGSEIHSFDM